MMIEIALRIGILLLCSVAAGCVQSTHRLSTGLDLLHQDPDDLDENFPPAIVELNFQSHGSRLNGIIYLANGAGPHPTVMLLHGFPGNEKNLDLAQALRRAGFNVLFFHYRGAWGSEGTFSFTNVIEDVQSAADMLRDRASRYRVDPTRLMTIGHSMGGFASLHAAARDKGIQCAAGLAAADFGARASSLSATPEIAERFAAYSDSLQMLAGFSGKQALAEIEANADAFSMTQLAPELAGRRVLLIAADRDEAVPADPTHLNMVQAFEAQPAIRLEHMILAGDHSFSWSRIRLIEEVVRWSLKC